MYGLEHGFSLDSGLGELDPKFSHPDFRHPGVYGGEFYYGFGEGDGAEGPAVPVIVKPTFTQQLWGFLKSPLGWAFIAGAIYLANQQGYLDKAKGLFGDE